jgi:hypothetical protein
VLGAPALPVGLPAVYEPERRSDHIGFRFVAVRPQKQGGIVPMVN